MPRNVRNLCLVGLIIAGLSLPQLATPPASRKDGIPLPKPSAPQKPRGPRGKVGGIFLMVDQPAATVRVWFPKSCAGHEGAIDTVFAARRQYPNTIAIMGIFGTTAPRDEEIARSMKWAGKPDMITINGQETFELSGPKGIRKVRFRGFEGKDYAVSDLKQVLDNLLKA